MSRFSIPKGVTVSTGWKVPTVLGAVAAAAPAFSPTDVAGLKVWYKADALVLNNDDAVASWTDSSGNLNHATEATNRPTYKTNIQNSLPAVLGDGSNDKLTCAGLGTGWSTSVGSLFVVFNPNSDTQYGLIDFSGASDTHWRFSNGNGYQGTFATVRLEATPAGMPSTGTYLHTIIHGATTYKMWSNSSSLIVNTTRTFGVSANLQLFNQGGAGFGSVYIMEVILYNTEVSDANRLLIEAYLNSKWAIY
jgi:hypothetical protein